MCICAPVGKPTIKAHSGISQVKKVSPPTQVNRKLSVYEMYTRKVKMKIKVWVERKGKYMLKNSYIEVAMLEMPACVEWRVKCHLLKVVISSVTVKPRPLCLRCCCQMVTGLHNKNMGACLRGNSGECLYFTLYNYMHYYYLSNCLLEFASSKLGCMYIFVCLFVFPTTCLINVF